MCIGAHHRRAVARVARRCPRGAASRNTPIWTHPRSRLGHLEASRQRDRAMAPRHQPIRVNPGSSHRVWAGGHRNSACRVWATNPASRFRLRTSSLAPSSACIICQYSRPDRRAGPVFNEAQLSVTPRSSTGVRCSALRRWSTPRPVRSPLLGPCGDRCRRCRACRPPAPLCEPLAVRPTRPGAVGRPSTRLTSRFQRESPLRTAEPRRWKTTRGRRPSAGGATPGSRGSRRACETSE